MWICPKCAAHNDDKTHICPVCGTRLLAAEYPAPVDPWAAHADTQTVMSPLDKPRAIVPAPQPPTQSVTQYPAVIEVNPRNGVPLRWVVTIATVFVVGVGVAAAVVIPRLLSDHHQGDGTPATTTVTGSPAPGTAPSSADPDPDEGGLVVAIGPGVVDGRADEVIAMLDVYFNGINAKDYPAVASVLDPDGTTDPDDLDAMKKLAAGTRSTTDSHVTLTSLDDAGKGLLSAEVVFQSDQKAGDGPADRPSETCTQWDVTYTLTHHGAYRIRESDASSQPC